MHWQDWALAAASLTFIVALIPTLLAKEQKPALSTSVMNSTISGGIAGVYLSLSLWFAAFTTAANCALWLVIAVQTRSLRRPARSWRFRKGS